MQPADLPAVFKIATLVHPDFPESAEVFAERLALAPEGCLLLVPDNVALGYCISHPWRAFQPPPLDSLLQGLPVSPATWYVHDVAILPELRGSGMGQAVTRILAEKASAAGLADLSLVAVNGSAPFWRRQGFETVSRPDLDAKLATYGEGARYMVRPLPASSDLPPA
ncbi:GNAT family N-acetyltransferase [Phreatobacter aquaticus]|uniref:GNAT family N-acetyltransferase n=1 Tax=Phreatobacter aquaticus TaxID=2570229 RepID=A0A4D7QTF0_9HYPH|nr:GNAT family N-acetyltransferase [Phreatobacter aquaticus]QCK88659.1 GNAT family N-acetyltransferase [Phreatobacter aquaticus]